MFNHDVQKPQSPAAPITVSGFAPEPSMADILVDMQQNGIDPQPYFALAADHLSEKYGSDIIEYAEKICEQAQNHNNDDLWIVWKTLHGLFVEKFPAYSSVSHKFHLHG